MADAADAAAEEAPTVLATTTDAAAAAAPAGDAADVSSDIASDTGSDAGSAASDAASTSADSEGKGDDCSAEDAAKVLELKTAANAFFAAGKYTRAIETYSEAIDVTPSSGKAGAILYANRAFCHLKTESFGSAVADAEEAIEMDETYVKGHYRLGSAKMALGKVKEAKNVFLRVCKIAPKSKDARAKLAQCKKQMKKEAFELAIGGGDARGTASGAEEVNADEIVVESSYMGPHLPAEGVTETFVKELLSHLREQKKLHRKYVLQLLIKANTYFRTLNSMIDISFTGVPEEGKEVEVGSDAEEAAKPIASDHFNVCGDTHGQVRGRDSKYLGVWQQPEQCGCVGRQEGIFL